MDLEESWTKNPLRVYLSVTKTAIGLQNTPGAGPSPLKSKHFQPLKLYYFSGIRGRGTLNSDQISKYKNCLKKGFFIKKAAVQKLNKACKFYIPLVEQKAWGEKNLGIRQRQEYIK